MYDKKEKIYPAYVSKYNSNHEKQVILLMIPNREGITSKYHGHFYCLNSFAAKSKLTSHKKVCKNKDFCNIIMPSDNTKILEFNKNQKSEKAPFIE